MGGWRFVIWWPQHGCRVLCEGPVADFPSCLWAGGGMGVTFSGAATEFAAGVSSLEIDTPILSPALGAVSAYERNYSKRALANACFELRNCPQGSRNSKLNALAYKMGRLVVRGWIECGRVESYLLRCCEANGLLADDGERQCRATLASGNNAGMGRPYHDIKAEWD